MRSVVHWDGDSFFASIEQASDRRLRGRPVAVGGARRGVVVSASREGRRFGVRPGMPMGKARRRCASLIALPGHFDLYEQFFQDILALRSAGRSGIRRKKFSRYAANVGCHLHTGAAMRAGNSAELLRSGYLAGTAGSVVRRGFGGSRTHKLDWNT